MLPKNIQLEGTSILVTGAAGFIGSNLVKRLFKEMKSGCVVGLDNMNHYYDVSLKEYRIREIEGQERKEVDWHFVRGSIADRELVNQLFADYKFDVVVNLAAQAGVRYSIENPDAYIESNMIGFYNILEACRHHAVQHLVYASSSSVYGGNKKVPFSTDDRVDNPVSLYAATKRSSTNDTKEFHKNVSRLSYPPVEYARTDRASMYFTNNVEIRMTPYAFLVYCYKSIKISCDIYAYIYNEC